MTVLKDKEVLDKIYEHKVDRIFYEKILAIRDTQLELTNLAKDYIDTTMELKEGIIGLEKLSDIFKEDFESLEDFKSYIVDLANRIDYSYGLAFTEEIEGLGILTMLCDDKKDSYRFIASYEDISIKGSPAKTYKMSYHLEKETGDLDIRCEARMFVASSCQCCDKLEYNLLFPDSEDVNHYIIVSELDGIYNKLLDINNEYKEKYSKYKSLTKNISLN